MHRKKGNLLIRKVEELEEFSNSNASLIGILTYAILKLWCILSNELFYPSLIFKVVSIRKNVRQHLPRELETALSWRRSHSSQIRAPGVLLQRDTSCSSGGSLSQRMPWNHGWYIRRVDRCVRRRALDGHCGGGVLRVRARMRVRVYANHRWQE